ncbi:MAG: signal peptidase I [Candidatus Izemoplasmatales bacterium]|jgi:signal peptidase|nr:signal peptidase I [Candidatus Izemoplasmatales bacterium]MDD3865242.1 signal peptidase I [Candidatus Izemoplasmatales bacterium]
MESTNNKKKTTIKTIGNIVFWVVLAIVALYAVISLSSKRNDQVTEIFGQTGLNVVTGSMEPTFSIDDIIFIDVIDYKTFDFSTLEAGDIITFMFDNDNDPDTPSILNSHRITRYVIDDNGYYHFYTQGDANNSEDLEPISESAVLGVWNGAIWAGAGKVVNFLIGPWGFFIFIVIPCFAFLVYEIFRFVKIVSEYNVQKAVGNRETIQQEALAMARAQLEAEMKAKTEAKEAEEPQE